MGDCAGRVAGRVPAEGLYIVRAMIVTAFFNFATERLDSKVGHRPVSSPRTPVFNRVST